MLDYYVSIFGWCSLQSNPVVSVVNLLVTLEDPEDHRVSWYVEGTQACFCYVVYVCSVHSLCSPLKVGPLFVHIFQG